MLILSDPKGKAQNSHMAAPGRQQECAPCSLPGQFQPGKLRSGDDTALWDNEEFIN